MPALSPDVLDLALRVSNEGYSVYVPLLWGKELENAHSKLLFLRRAVELRASSEWKAGAAEVNRPILDRLTSLCRSIISRHPGERIGVIGNCLTGVFPFALAARVPQVAAPIASQPTLPLSFSKRAAGQTGLSPAELKMLHQRIERDPTFQLLGFRFEEDRASRRERFDTFEHEFGKRFLNGMIPLADYHVRDGLDPHVHAVLTSCYSDDSTFATFQAWRECASFLKAKLSGGSPSSYKLHRREKVAGGCAMVRDANECSGH
jgi:dienelactone hydrolase